MYHPIHLSVSKDLRGLQRRRSRAFYGLDLISTEEGSETFQYRDVVAVLSGESYDVTLTLRTQRPGMFVTAWEGDINYVVSDLLPIPFMVNATLSSPRQYLPQEYALGAVGTWDYSYTLTKIRGRRWWNPSETVYGVPLQRWVSRICTVRWYDCGFL